MPTARTRGFNTKEDRRLGIVIGGEVECPVRNPKPRRSRATASSLRIKTNYLGRKGDMACEEQKGKSGV